MGQLRAARRRQVSDGRARPRLLPWGRARAGPRLPVSRGRRRARNASRPARGDAGNRAWLGRHEAVAAARRRAGGPRPDADRAHHRCAARETARHRRRVRAGEDHGKHRARHPQGVAGGTAAPLSAIAHAESDRAPDHRFAGAKAGGQARAPRTLSRAVRNPRHLGQARRQCARGAAVRSGVDSVAPPDADGRKPDPAVQAAGAAEGARQGRRIQGRARARGWRGYDGRRHRGMVRAARD